MEAVCNGITIHYREQGQGTPLLLLHGFPLDGSMWDEQLTSLSKHFRIIAPDLRGFGASAASDRTSMDEMADDMAALLGHLNIGQAVVGGFSMGGYVTFAILRRHPHLVRALILANTKAEPDTAEGKANRMTMAQAIRERGAVAASEPMLPKLLSPAALERRPELAKRLMRTMLAQPPEGLSAAVLAMAERPDMSPQLAGIRVPTLVIGSDSDEVIPFTVSESTAAAIPGAVLRRIEGAGHAANMEQPEKWNRFVLDWYDL